MPRTRDTGNENPLIKNVSDRLSYSLMLLIDGHWFFYTNIKEEMIHLNVTI